MQGSIDNPDLDSRLSSILRRVDELRSLDSQFGVFGAELHQYEFGPALSESCVAEFERQFEIDLPAEYRAIVRRVGNGGPGPFYGLKPIPSQVGERELAARFPHTEDWNVDLDECTDEVAGDYFSPRHVDGTLPIIDFGCGHDVLLVLTGIQRGTLWLDERASDGGIHRFQTKGKPIGLFDLYDEWLDE
ncbi:MAG: hypothetical protein ACJAYU_001054, partial [Bradymonadia bacterium]